MPFFFLQVSGNASGKRKKHFRLHNQVTKRPQMKGKMSLERFNERPSVRFTHEKGILATSLQRISKINIGSIRQQTPWKDVFMGNFVAIV
jgi:hypothetical protein